MELPLNCTQQNLGYHYTSLQALFEIIRTKTLRLTNFSSSNDKKELQYSIDDFHNILIKMVTDGSDEKYRQYCEVMFESITNHIKEYAKYDFSPITTYGISLTSDCNSLLHWGMYADQMRGVNIAIDIDAIGEIHKVHSSINSNWAFLDYYEALYTQEQKYDFIKNKMLLFLKYIPHLKESAPQLDNRQIALDNMYGWVALTYDKMRRFVKESGFVGEKESRICFEENTIVELRKMNAVTEKSEDIDKIRYSELERVISELGLEKRHYAVSPRGIRSFHNLCLSNIWGSKLIPEITLGPLCVQNKNELRKFFDDNGLGDTKILESDIPIR